jgi:hypothetical protein
MNKAKEYLEDSEGQNIYAIYHTLCDRKDVQKIVSPNGVVNFIFIDGSVMQSDLSLSHVTVVGDKYHV